MIPNFILEQDGLELPKPIGFEVDEEITKLPDSSSSYFATHDFKDVVLRFIEQYYQVGSLVLHIDCYYDTCFYM